MYNIVSPHGLHACNPNGLAHLSSHLLGLDSNLEYANHSKILLSLQQHNVHVGRKAWLSLDFWSILEILKDPCQYKHLKMYFLGIYELLLQQQKPKEIALLKFYNLIHFFVFYVNILVSMKVKYLGNTNIFFLFMSYDLQYYL